MTPTQKFLCQIVIEITDNKDGNPGVFLTRAMELTKCDFRAMMSFDFMNGLYYEESYNRLCQAFGKVAPGKSTVCR